MLGHTAWNVEDVLSIAPDLTVEDAREVLRVALDGFDANNGINWDVLAVWADYIKEGK